MSEHSKLAARAEQIGFHVYTNFKTAQTLMLVEGSGVIPDNRFDSKIFMKAATLKTETRIFNRKKEFVHSFAMNYFNNTESSKATISHTLWLKRYHQYCNTQNIFKRYGSRYQITRQELDRIDRFLYDYSETVQSPALAHYSKKQLKKKLLPFMLADMNPELTALCLTNNIKANSLLATALREKIIDSSAFNDLNSMPIDWIEATVLPIDVETLIAAKVLTGNLS